MRRRGDVRESEGDRVVMQVGCPGQETDEGRGGRYLYRRYLSSFIRAMRMHAGHLCSFSALRPSLCPFSALCVLAFPVQPSHAPPPPHTPAACVHK